MKFHCFSAEYWRHLTNPKAVSNITLKPSGSDQYNFWYIERWLKQNSGSYSELTDLELIKYNWKTWKGRWYFYNLLQLLLTKQKLPNTLMQNNQQATNGYKFLCQIPNDSPCCPDTVFQTAHPHLYHCSVDVKGNCYQWSSVTYRLDTLAVMVMFDELLSIYTVVCQPWQQQLEQN